MARTLLLASALLAAGLVGAYLARRPAASEPPATVHVTLETIRQTADLVVLRVGFQQLVESRIDGHLGGVRCVVLASGTALIATDLEKAELTLDAPARRATLLLTQPEVLTAGLDHEAAAVLLTDRWGLWQAVPGATGEAAAVQAALVEAQRAMHRFAARAAHIAQARRRAETVLAAFLAERGWQVEIQWRPQ